MQGQLRLAGIGAGIVGLDYGPIFTIAQHRGVSLPALAQFLPGIEAAAVAKLNEGLRD